MEKKVTLKGPENQVAALVLLLEEAARMMSDATGSYGCEHLDPGLDDWLMRARPFFPRNLDTQGAVQAVLDGRSPRPEEEPAALESWKKRYGTDPSV